MSPEIHDWIFDHKNFTHQYEHLLLDSVSTQFECIDKNIPDIETINAEYLLNCSSLLSTSPELNHSEVALRIAQYVLTCKRYNEAHKFAAAAILNSMANNLSIDLAIKNNYLVDNFYNMFGLLQFLNFKKSNIEHKIYLKSGNISANAFQASAWKALNSVDCISLSAPTSVGKSYLLLQWIIEEVYKNTINIVYLVPTRALVNQVETDLRELAKKNSINVNFISIPSKYAISSTKSNLCIFTQERLHYFLSGDGDFNINALVIDEAHKVGDGYRGILLQQAIERIVYNGEARKIVFAVPNSSNPEVLIEDLPDDLKKNTVSNSSVMVNQNLFWVSEDDNSSKSWAIDHIGYVKNIRIGTFKLTYEPDTNKKRISFIAYHIGKDTHGNIIYADGAADAEKIALLLADMIDENIDNDLTELAKLSQKAVHTQYRLSDVIKKGIAFHYGNMPLILRLEIERLFKSGKVKFLICTSTLIEGVNLPCKNIFLRCPQKGKNMPMSPEDFWNLAGRAGRWGKEFQGNIFCIDPHDSGWAGGVAPTKRKKIPIQKTVDAVLQLSSDFLRYLDTPDDPAFTQNISKFEYMESYLSSLVSTNKSLTDSPWAKRFDVSILSEIQYKIESIINKVDFAKTIIIKNPGVSVIGMINLFNYFSKRTKNVEELLPPAPTSQSAVQDMTAIFTRINKCFGNKFGYGKSGPIFYNALLTVHWMLGYPLPRIIDGRIKNKQNKSQKITISTEIRDAMAEVENVARFTAPKYLSCYNDILKDFYEKNNRIDLAQNIKDLNLLLEFGVPLKTQISLMSLGLSRTTAIELSANIPNDALTRLEAYDYLSSQKWSKFDLPEAMQKEILHVISNHTVEDLINFENITWDS